MAEISLEEWLKQLVIWSESLAYEAKQAQEHIPAVIAEGGEIPDGCPSRASMLLMEFSSVDKKLSEVLGCFKGVKAAICEIV